MARANAGEVRGRLRRRLAVALAGSGWSPAVPSPVAEFSLGELVCPVSGGVEATAAIRSVSSVPDRLPVVIDTIQVGAGYGPLRRLWPLLGPRYHLPVVPSMVFESEVGNGPRVSSAAEVEEAVEFVSGLVASTAVPFAGRFGSLERLLEAVGYREDGGWVDQTAVALLAAAGRLEEARRALGRYRPLTGSADGDRAARQFVHQIGRFIESGGDPALIPAQPPPPRVARAPAVSLSEVWRTANARREALEAVRRLDPETDPDLLRAALERELAQRGLTESPFFYEQALDTLHLSATERAERLAGGVTELGRLGIRPVRWLRERPPLPDLSPPGWLELPDRAAFAVTSRPDAQFHIVELGLSVIGSLQFAGSFALAGSGAGTAPAVENSFHLLRCGSRRALAVQDQSSNYAPFISSRAVVWRARRQEHCKKRSFGLACTNYYYIRGLYLRGLREFSASLPTPPSIYGGPGEVVGLTQRTIYVEAPNQSLWSAPSHHQTAEPDRHRCVVAVASG